jgi:nucleoside-diphosphate-sugar epimerase
MAYATFIRAALRGGCVVLRDQGRQLRTPTYIDDCVEGIIRAAEQGDDDAIYNIAGPEDVRLATVPRQLARLVGHGVATTAAPPAPGDPRVATVSVARARHELGFEPRTRLVEGLARQLSAAVRPSCTQFPGRAEDRAPRTISWS